MNGLCLKNVTKRFDDLLVLDNVSLELTDGELLVLLGPSGCGKSTLLRIIAGLEELTSGEIFLHDCRVDQLPPKDREVAMVFQNYSLYPHMSVEKNIAFPLKIAKYSKAQITKRVHEVAELLGLTEKLPVKPGQLSGGQRQRVALGRAIVREPSIFLLDEPLSNLDADLRVRMRQEIVKIQRQLNKTLIHVTHDQSEALTMADRIALLENGTIAQLGKPEELYKTPASLYVARFIGFPKINVIDGSIDSGILKPFDIPVEQKSLLEQTNPQIGIRPEHIDIAPGGKYTGLVQSCEYLGEQYIATFAFDKSELTVSGLSRPVNPGETIRFDFDSSLLLFFDPSNGHRIN